MGVTVWSLKRGTTNRYSHSQAHHRLPTTTELSTMGIPFEEVRPKYGHEAFPCEGSKGGYLGIVHENLGRAPITQTSCGPQNACSAH